MKGANGFSTQSSGSGLAHTGGTVLDGFLDETGRARGRPVGVAQDASGALLVADDVGNVVWRVTHQP